MEKKVGHAGQNMGSAGGAGEGPWSGGRRRRKGRQGAREAQGTRGRASPPDCGLCRSQAAASLPRRHRCRRRRRLPRQSRQSRTAAALSSAASPCPGAVSRPRPPQTLAAGWSLSTARSNRFPSFQTQSAQKKHTRKRQRETERENERRWPCSFFAN